MLFAGSADASGHDPDDDGATPKAAAAVVKESGLDGETVVNGSSSRRTADTWPEMSLIIAASDDPRDDGEGSSGRGNVTLVIK